MSRGIYSEKYNFSFFHTPRTGGTSFGMELRRLINGRIIDLHHKRMLHIQNDFNPNIYNKIMNSFKFGFVRNPWDRTYSWYCKHIPKKPMSFEEFATNSVCTPQYVVFVDEKENVIADYIARFENYKDETIYIKNRIGLNELNPLKLNGSKREFANYQDFYDDKKKDLVYKTFKKDIELFNYEF